MRGEVLSTLISAVTQVERGSPGMRDSAFVVWLVSIQRYAYAAGILAIKSTMYRALDAMFRYAFSRFLQIFS